MRYDDTKYAFKFEGDNEADALAEYYAGLDADPELIDPTDEEIEAAAILVEAEHLATYGVSIDEWEGF